MVLTTIMALCAVVVAGTLVRRSADGASERPIAGANVVTPLDSVVWKELLILSRPVFGSGRIPMVVFSDFECPSCRAFHQALKEVVAELPGEFDVRYAHYPLGYHRFAAPSARVSECAAEQGGFPAMSDLLFAEQDSLGLLSWAELATRSGIADPAATASCASLPTDSVRFARIVRGIELADAIGARGTPTVVIDGGLWSRTPSKSALAELASSTKP